MSSHHGAYTLGCTHPTMDCTMGFATPQGDANLKNGSQWGLRAETCPHERIRVIKSAGCEYVLGLALTARQAPKIGYLIPSQEGQG